MGLVFVSPVLSEQQGLEGFLCATATELPVSIEQLQGSNFLSQYPATLGADRHCNNIYIYKLYI